MKRAAALLSSLFALASLPAQTEEWLDRVGDALTFSGFHDQLRGQLSGSIDLEGYYTPEPVSDLIFNERDALFNPRLLLFLDVQVGGRVYFFAQSRLDRGFDPADQHLRLRLDEYALRFTPWEERRFNVQVGQFATVIGNWTERHLSWDNPFVTAPLPYGNLTGMWDREPVPSTGTLLAWAHVRPASGGARVHADKDQRLPLIWGPAYGSGAAVSGRWGKVEYAFEVKNVAPSARPSVWSATEIEWSHPAVSGRMGWRPNMMWNLGVSASRSSYLLPEAAYELAPGRSRGDYRQLMVGHDIAFAWHHFQFWAEIFAARFEIPGITDADTVAYYLEAKYKFTPQFFGAMRWNQQLFAEIDSGAGQRTPWGRDVWRLDVAPTYRFTPHVQAKLELSLRHEAFSPRAYTHAVAAQLTVRF